MHVEIHCLVVGTMEYAVGGVINGVAVLGVEPFRRKAMTLVES